MSEAQIIDQFIVDTYNGNVDSLIANIETHTGCKIFNKDIILKTLHKETNFEIENVKKHILQNLVEQLSFNAIFKSRLELDIIFKYDDVNILYKNTKVELDKLNSIKEDLLKNKLEFLPKLATVFVDNVMIVIKKLITKDLSLKYFCRDIPYPYWKLFEIKCLKYNKDAYNVYSKYIHYDDIMSGKIYLEKKEDPELNYIIKQIKDESQIDETYRLEVMTYLEDDETDFFINTIEKLDSIEKTNDIAYIKILLGFIDQCNNKMIKIYFLHSIIKAVIQNTDLLSNKNFRDIISKKIFEFQKDLEIFVAAELSLTNDLFVVFKQLQTIINNFDIKL
jgi:hypothetical protein